MGSCQQNRLEPDCNSYKISSSKQVQSKSSMNASQGKINSDNKLEIDQLIEDEANLLTVYSRIKKDKASYNFQEDESIRRQSVQESIKFSGSQKRRLFRTSVTHSHFEDLQQNSGKLNQSSVYDEDVKSVKSILKKSSKLKENMSGSPETRSVHFARGTHFRTKSQNPIKRSRKNLNYSPLFSENKPKPQNVETKSPNWKKHRDNDSRQIRTMQVQRFTGTKPQKFTYF